MALEAIVNSHNDLFNMTFEESLYATHYGYYTTETMESASVLDHNLAGGTSLCSPALPQCSPSVTTNRRVNLGVQGRNKRRKKARVCKNKEEAETQRMTHIAVERNRRKQMNEHLAVLRSLMPESYAQRGDQASIVGGAIEYVKELEHLLHTLEVQKLLLMSSKPNQTSEFPVTAAIPDASQAGNKYTLSSNSGVGDIEVILIETHANIRLLLKKNPRQLWKLVSGFQTLHMCILHLNVTCLDTLVLYSISAKVEELCQLTSSQCIAQTLHDMLKLDAASSLLLTYN